MLNYIVGTYDEVCRVDYGNIILLLLVIYIYICTYRITKKITKDCYIFYLYWKCINGSTDKFETTQKSQFTQIWILFLYNVHFVWEKGIYNNL